MLNAHLMFSNEQNIELNECIKKCQRKLDAKLDLHSPDQLHHFTKLKIDYIEYLLDTKNELIIEFFLRKSSQESEHDIVQVIYEELDFMISEKRLVIPLFLSFAQVEPSKKAQKNDQLIFI